MNRNRIGLCLAAILCVVVASWLEVGATRGQAEDVKAAVTKADEQFEKKNYADAAKLYQERIAAEPHDDGWRHAVKQNIACQLRLQLFDDALAAAEQYVKDTSGTPWEARAERLTGNLYMTIPHWGTRAGGTFHRAQWKQGIQVRSYNHDKKHAIAHLERARMLYAELDGKDAALKALPEKERDLWHNERIECTFDLASACARFGIYENSWNFWYAFWGERDDDRSETAGEDDFDEYYSQWQWRRQRPIGLRIGQDGKPEFPFKPAKYGDDINDDQKILFLLDEARQLDQTDNRRYTALSYYRQAMLARSRFGMDRLNQYASIYWYNNAYPLKEELEAVNPWEMKDDEAIVLAGGRVIKTTLPKQWDVLSLLRTVVSDYDKAGLADEGQYSVGLYYQSRQQYTTALGEYDKLFATADEKSEWRTNGRTQVDRIKASQVRISQAGVQLPVTNNSADPTSVQISYRNTSKVHFVAREIDHIGLLRDLRGREGDSDKGYPYFWALQSWHNYYVYRYNNNDPVRAIAAKYLGKEVARWSSEVKDDGTHRYATATLATPLTKRGAYLVYAYLGEPPKGDADKTGLDAIMLGASSAVVVLADLAIVDKKTNDGQLYFITDARSGAPVANADVEALEVWNTSEKVGNSWRTIYHKTMHKAKTNENGLAEIKRPVDRRNWGQLHLLVDGTAGSGPGAEAKVPNAAPRVAWSGMSYWSGYSPSRMRDGQWAYCITDRPVYRPNQTVKFKLWVRHMNNGLYENQPDQSINVHIYDPRGNKVVEFNKQTDQFGGLEGEYTLPEEPALGMYRIYVNARNYIGGQNFRVEEYKKPEFEVTVEPGKDHAKLGEKLTANIKATYFFGGPVTDATAKYKVFREEYRHSYYFPGRWDWLYGPGYGWAWYDYDWMPFWGRMSCCRVAPGWWYGYGYGSAATPVRELVQQGESRISGDGTLKVEIDTAPALRNHGDVDHRYVIEAEVRDASRRVITGEGAVKVTRQAYYSMIQPTQGYYRPGEEMFIKIRCLTPDNQPVKTEGVVTVSEVVFGGPNNAKISETKIDQWKAGTDEQGELTIQLRHEKSGQLKIKFESPDQWGGTVEGFGLVWVCGNDFDGKLYRFNNLELITDKREYKPGEVAHVMINTQHANSYVLFSDDVDNNVLLNHKLLHLPNRSTVVDIPITRNGAPNFFIEATTVAATRVHQQAARIVVPPEDGVLNVSIKTDKPEYGPGDKANVEVFAATLDGKPASAQVTVSAFDKSVLYIQDELTPPIAKFFHGNLRNHNMQMQTNLYEQFSTYGNVARPFEQLWPLPPSWNGVWGPEVGDWRTVGADELTLFEGAERETLRKSEARADDRDALAEGQNRRQAGESLQQNAAKSLTSAAAPAAADAAGYAGRGADKPGEKSATAGGDGGDTGLVEAEVRSKFADTALWLTTLTTGDDGKASASFNMPENLTTWKVNAWAMTKDTKVGQADTSAITTKNLLVRLQAPRFFMEYDEVVISANVNNYLKSPKRAQVTLDVPDKLLKLSGSTPKTVEVNVPANGEVRVDWRVNVTGEGVAAVTVKALTNEESDAMRMTFPVLVHGMNKQVATTGSMRPSEGDEKTVTVELDVPEKRRPELTALEVQYAPTLVGAMLDALPYCLDYPYGCTEQTMSRFLPAVLTLKTLQQMGIKLEDVRDIRGRLAEIRRIEKGQNIKLYGTYADSPVFDSAELNRIIQSSLNRIASMQGGDGGWGWWKGNESNPYLTSYVLYALCTAQTADVQIDENMIQRGMNYLQNWEQGWLADKNWQPDASRCFSAYVLSLKGRQAAIKPPQGDQRPGALIERLWTERDKVNLYGKSLLSLAMAQLNDTARANTVLTNILQFIQNNDETQVANLRTPDVGWWYWWNNDIETNAWALRALVKLQPNSPIAPRMVKWLLNNRRNGYYWRSTRDTTMVVNAMADFVTATGEGEADYELTLDLDNGKTVKTVKINRDTFFTYDNRFLVEGVSLSGGKHTLKITKKGKGALYFNTYLRYFTKEEHITAAGHELKVDRSYYRLEQIPYEVEVEGADGQKLVEKRLRYERIPVKDGDTVKSGDVVQVELKVASDNDYTFLAMEDMKPAGFEPTQLTSGGKGQEGFYSYMELRDEKTVVFLGSIQQGEHLLRYRLRAEVPGVFHALPTRFYAMYVPELQANSEEQVIKITD